MPHPSDGLQANRCPPALPRGSTAGDLRLRQDDAVQALQHQARLGLLLGSPGSEHPPATAAPPPHALELPRAEVPPAQLPAAPHREPPADEHLQDDELKYQVLDKVMATAGKKPIREALRLAYTLLANGWDTQFDPPQLAKIQTDKQNTGNFLGRYQLVSSSTDNFFENILPSMGL